MPPESISSPPEKFPHLKALVLIILLIANLGFIASWYMQHQREDQAEISAMKQFYHSDTDYRIDNAAIAMIGLSAPASVGINTYDWALKIVEQSVHKSDAAYKRVMEQPLTKERMLEYTSSQDAFIVDLQALMAESGTPVTLQGTTKNLSCGLTVDCTHKKLPKQDAIKITALVRDNSFLLHRYDRLLDHKHFVNLPYALAANGQFFIEIHRLYLAKAMLDRQAKPDHAARAWLKDARFLKQAMTDENGFVTRAILILMYGQCQRIMPFIFDDPRVVKKYKTELLDVLSNFGPRQMNMHNIFLGESRVIMPFAALFGDKQQLQYYHLAQDFIHVAYVPASQFVMEKDKFLDIYSFDHAFYQNVGDWLHPIQSFITNLLISGIAKSVELVRNMHGLDARNRALNLYVRMKANGVPPSRYEEFVKQHSDIDLSFHLLPGARGDELKFDTDAETLAYTNTYLNIDFSWEY